MAIISFGNEEHVKIFTMGYEECYGADLFASKWVMGCDAWRHGRNAENYYGL